LHRPPSDPEQRESIEAASGGTSLRDLVAGILRPPRPDPDAEDARTRATFALPAGAEPSHTERE
jgi:hypothetical protein